jgi:hypothetical protein
MIPKILISAFFFSFTSFANCQDTVYFDKNQKATDKRSAFYFEVDHEDYTNPERFVVESFYTDGGRKEINYYKDKSKEEITGVSEKWYPGGQIKSRITHNGGILNDTVITYWETGQLKREDIFQNEKFIKGTCYDISGKKIRHFDYEVMPEYPGGESELLKDIYTGIEMPEIVRTTLMKEKVIAKFHVGTEGFVGDIEIVKGDYPEVNNEVIRVLSSLKRWKPGMVDGEPVKVWYVLPVTFEVK